MKRIASINRSCSTSLLRLIDYLHYYTETVSLSLSLSLFDNDETLIKTILSNNKLKSPTLIHSISR
jgi:hypothetical protein